MAITDVPVSPLSTMGGFQSLAHTLTVCCLCFECVDVGCHDLLAEVVIGGGVIHKEHAVVDWFEWFVVHVLIIGATGAKSRRGVPDVDPSRRRSIRQHRPEPT